MKNLENYGVQELNTREIQETDGGVGEPWLIARAVEIAIAVESAIEEWFGD